MPREEFPQNRRAKRRKRRRPAFAAVAATADRKALSYEELDKRNWSVAFCSWVNSSTGVHGQVHGIHPCVILSYLSFGLFNKIKRQADKAASERKEGVARLELRRRKRKK